MNSGQTVFRQLLQFLPRHEFNLCVRRYCGNYRARSFSTFDQFLCLAYAQMAGRASLRDIEICLNSHREKFYHIGFRGAVSRSTLADANEHRDWGIFQDFGHVLIRMAQQLYCGEPFVLELNQPLYAFDSITINSATIDLCLTLFPLASVTNRLVRSTNVLRISAAAPGVTWSAVLFIEIKL